MATLVRGVASVGSLENDEQAVSREPIYFFVRRAALFGVGFFSGICVRSTNLSPSKTQQGVLVCRANSRAYFATRFSAASAIGLRFAVASDLLVIGCLLY